MARTDDHDDPNSEGTARVLQMAAMAASVTEALVRLSAQRTVERQHADERAASAARAQRQADHVAAQVAWTPASDPEWLREAGALDVGRAWSAAVPWALTDPAAAAAQGACEERLRDLHPDAMRRYDWLRQDGADPRTAMRDVAPLFAQPQDTRIWLSGPAAASSALPSGLHRHVVTEQGRASDERKAAAANLDTRPPATSAVDKAAIDSLGTTSRTRSADTQRAANVSRTPASVAGEGYPLGLDQAATAEARRAAERAATATRAAISATPPMQDHTATWTTPPRTARR
ncbi:MAG: hypothetical protein M3P48_02760 [Actinomycetota bacterium]|nr:hypothetical protein [Actinomycetota bacterium]